MLAARARTASHTPYIPSRRAVLRTAAWTAPAIVVGTAAPAFAGSGLAPSPTLSGSVSTSGKTMTISTTATSAPTGSLLVLRMAEAYFHPTQGNMGAEAVPALTISATGWPTTASWTKDTAANTRYVSIAAGQGAAFPVVFTLTWSNNSVNVGSFTGTITATFTVPDRSPTTQTLRA
ncbi:hypothetical protein [Nocardioides daphniae]|uniref:Uncharacterized protein n=1 Tax=Nocardioides daphniae TaxID=402297 RepID=A0ABQ1PYS1_9ACTN|nr:hypothetical protein [Nocardioides daphniae]GGD07277.1 hypothetical protein GCM10007231_02470 [Nocardioides daphniae]